MKQRFHKYLTITIILTLAAGALFFFVNTTKAGIYSSSSEVTYKEYWVDHDEFTGGCYRNDDGEIVDTHPHGGSWYLEPKPCEKVLEFEIPDNPSQALKAEIYLDLWRNYDEPSATYWLNDNPKHYTDVGSDWSRTPYVAEIPRNELQQGTNTITMGYATRTYHVHDIAIRIYYDETHPLIPGEGSDVTPPQGSLLEVTADNGTFPLQGSPNNQLLTVNSDQLQLTANAANAKFIEFHGYYDGYDEDNDGNFRDWHNLGRNNWHPGGNIGEYNKNPHPELGGTIDHIGSVAVGDVPTATYSVTWDLPHIPAQSNVKFKIRVVDDAGNVREAAGGVSGNFRLDRNKPVLAYMIPDFTDFVLWDHGSKPAAVTVDIDLPADLSDFDTAYIIGNYYRNPRISINGENEFSAFAFDEDYWTLSVKELPHFSYLQPGSNQIEYIFPNPVPEAFGSFVERPGPMIVLKRTGSAGEDTEPPTLHSQNPAPGAVEVPRGTNIALSLMDANTGINQSTIAMRVNGVGVTPQKTGSKFQYVLTYNPPGDFGYGDEVTVAVDACDYDGNCLTDAQYSFTIEEQDLTPPQITNVTVQETDTRAVISWTTDEAADSEVKYGLTDSYELGTVSDSAFKTEHSLEITGLTPETLYFFRISSTDDSENSNTSTYSGSFTTREPARITSDDFNACQLRTDLWTFVDPMGHSNRVETGEQIEISVPPGSAHDLWTNNKNAPRLMQYANDEQNVVVEVKFESTVDKRVAMQGILVEQDEDNFLRFNFEGDGPGIKVRATAIIGNAIAQNKSKDIGDVVPDETAPLYLRVQRAGTSWSVLYSTDGETWHDPGLPLSQDIFMESVGVFAGNGATNPAHTAVIDYFFRTDEPINPEDAVALHLQTATVGNGNIEKASACGNPAVVTAQPVLGWSFDSWSGVVVTTTNPLTVPFGFGDVLTATFTRDEYNLAINIANEVVVPGAGPGGTVSKTPDNPFYYYDDLVTLTAEPYPGWTFTSWGGAVFGTNISTTLAMYQHEVVTATFTQEQYDLQVVTIGQGDVDVSPDGPYVYDDVVTLTAVPESGWALRSWEGGGASGKESPTQVTMTQNTVVTATFANEFLLTLNVEGDGSLTVEPEKPKYLYGEVVTITASAPNYWEFTGWQGDATGDANPLVLEMMGDQDVTAVFTQVEFPLFMPLMMSSQPGSNAAENTLPPRQTAVPNTAVAYAYYKR